MSKYTQRKNEYRFEIGARGLGLAILLVGFLLIAGALGSVVGGAGFILLGMVLMFGAPFAMDCARSIASAFGGDNTAEKVDKLALALGLKWQVIPERRRWVTKNTADPKPEDEQPQVLHLAE